MAIFRLLKERVGDHPHIVRVLEVNFDEPPFYVEMDYLVGQDLPGWCASQGGPAGIPFSTKLELVAQVADALQAAHQAGVIHRDVKPSNILVSSAKAQGPGPPPPPLAKLTDFGIGQVVSDETLADVTRAGTPSTTLAGTSSQSGTQLYLAPELLAGHPASTRSDIYSLGVVLYQLLCGDFRRPVTTDWESEIHDTLVREDLRQCFAGKPNDRFAAAGQFAMNLRAWEARQERRAREFLEQCDRDRLQRQNAQRRRWLALSAAAVVVLAAVASALAYGLRQAQTARQAAFAERERQRLYAYASDMKAAQIALLQNNPGTAVNLLQRHVPKPGESDLRGVEWRYLWEETRSDDRRRLDHPAMVHTATFLHDPRQLVTASQDNRVRIWDTSSGSLLRQFDAAVPQGGLTKALSASRDGGLVAFPTTRGVRILESTQWTTLRELPSARPPVCLSPDNRWLAYASSDYAIQIWSLLDRRVTGTLTGHPWFVLALRFSPDSRIFASGSTDSRIFLWSMTTLQPLLPPLVGHQSGVGAVVFTPDGRTLVTDGDDQTLRWWSVASGQEMILIRDVSIRGLHSMAAASTWAAGGNRLLWTERDGSVRITRLASLPDIDRSESCAPNLR